MPWRSKQKVHPEISPVENSGGGRSLPEEPYHNPLPIRRRPLCPTKHYPAPTLLLASASERRRRGAINRAPGLQAGSSTLNLLRVRAASSPRHLLCSSAKGAPHYSPSFRREQADTFFLASFLRARR